MKGIKWGDKNFELVILAGFLIVMSCLSFLNVIMRYFFKSALSWSDEVCCYCLALSAFFSLPCAIRMGSSIRVDTLLTVLPKKVQTVMETICNVIMVFFLIWLLKGTIGIVQNAMKIGQASPALQIPLAWIYGVMGFAVTLAIFRYIQVLVLKFVKKDHNQTEGKTV